ncbi:MAG: NfeD family protein [Pseudomonadota bacterium]
MIWWGWLIVGAVLLSAELLGIEAQFYLVFLGVSALLVGIGDLLGIPMGDTVEWFVFAALSLFFMFTFRRTLYEKLKLDAGGYTATISGDTVDIDVELAPGDETRASYRGSEWTIRNTGDETLAAGTRVRVVRVDGVKLHVE